MEKLFLELLNRSITAGWLILAVILIRLLFRRAPKWVTGCLWILVAVRLVIPFSVESVYSLIPRTETVPYEILY
ncbi:MAG: peptidase M56, partial [Clostridia bacterium]|nr:peptidase M56 [Clostridia bacterium]